MVVLKPMFPGERVRICTKCNTLGIESPDRARSTFRWIESKGRAEAHCRRCDVQRTLKRRTTYTEAERAEQREQRRIKVAQAKERREQDPEAARVHREKMARWARERLKDPEVREARNRRQRELAKRRSADPAWVEARRESARITYRLRREREGKPLRLPRGSTPKDLTPKEIKENNYRIGPFRRWVESLVAEHERYVAGSNDPKVIRRYRNRSGEPIESTIAERLDLRVRQLHRIRYVNQAIPEKLVDYCTTRDGSVSTADLYPEVNDSPEQSCSRLLLLRALYGLWYLR